MPDMRCAASADGSDAKLIPLPTLRRRVLVLAEERTYGTPMHSRKDILHHVSVHIREPIIAPAMAIRQPRVIKTEQMKNGGVEIVDMHLVLDHRCSDVIRGAIAEAAFHAAAGEP